MASTVRHATHAAFSWLARACHPQKVDVADSENHAVRHVQKYLRDHRISGIQNQMYIIMALHAEEVFTDRIYYCLHQLVAGNRGRRRAARGTRVPAPPAAPTCHL